MPIWNFDGSSTGQAPGENSDVYLRPCAVYPDPFRRGNNNIMYVTHGIRTHLNIQARNHALTRSLVS